MDLVSSSGQVLIDSETRAAMVPIVVTQRIIKRREQADNRKKGIEQTKKVYEKISVYQYTFTRSSDRNR